MQFLPIDPPGVGPEEFARWSDAEVSDAFFMYRCNVTVHADFDLIRVMIVETQSMVLI
jgi:hypothetical protein